MYKLIFLVLLLPMFASAQTIDFTFTWTAPGDDNNIGTASKYEIAYAEDSLILKNWVSATKIPDSLMILPSVAGTAETLHVSLTVIQERTYYFAIKTADEVPNWSPISNIVQRYIPDITPPAVIIDFQWKP